MNRAEGHRRRGRLALPGRQWWRPRVGMEEAKDMKALSYSSQTVIRKVTGGGLRVLQRPTQRAAVESEGEVRGGKLTDGPVGLGTRYRAQWSNTGPATVGVVPVRSSSSWETYATARAWASGSKASSPTRPQERATAPTWNSTQAPGPAGAACLLAMRHRTRGACSTSRRRSNRARNVGLGRPPPSSPSSTPNRRDRAPPRTASATDTGRDPAIPRRIVGFVLDHSSARQDQACLACAAANSS